MLRVLGDFHTCFADVGRLAAAAVAVDVSRPGIVAAAEEMMFG